MPIPDNLYKGEVDFTTLALQYPQFSKRLKTNGQLDFSDPESIRQLTKSLLHRDFNLTIDLPEDRLCPPVPNRFNYILYAQRLVDSTQLDYSNQHSPLQKAIGLDIGTGASAIYPLLACRQRPTWLFLATEIDEKSRQYAVRNIQSNGLEDRIRILETDLMGGKILPTAQLERFDDYSIRIQIVNPPFYSSEAEMLQSARQKARPPNSACTGSSVEMITEGGEVAFVSRLIEESMLPINRSKIQWFSSMLGKLSSVSLIINRLKRVSCSNYAVTEFVQGQRTRRWCIAWSWLSLRPPVELSRGLPGLEKGLMPFPSEASFEVLNQDRQSVGSIVDTEISSLDLEWRCLASKDGGTGRSPRGDVWSRKARRRKQHDQEMKDAAETEESTDDEREPAIVFAVSLRRSPPGDTAETKTVVHIRWLQGQDAILFESFCGWLKRKVRS